MESSAAEPQCGSLPSSAPVPTNDDTTYKPEADTIPDLSGFGLNALGGLDISQLGKILKAMTPEQKAAISVVVKKLVAEKLHDLLTSPQEDHAMMSLVAKRMGLKQSEIPQLQEALRNNQGAFSGLFKSTTEAASTSSSSSSTEDARKAALREKLRSRIASKKNARATGSVPTNTSIDPEKIVDDFVHNLFHDPEQFQGFLSSMGGETAPELNAVLSDMRTRISTHVP